MQSFESFENMLRRMLAHLYDPIYRPPDMLWKMMGCSRDQGIDILCELLIQNIEELKPARTVPQTARSWRIYEMLHHRFVANLTQEATAELVGITSRHLRRETAEAIHALALHIWEKQHSGLPAQTFDDPSPDTNHLKESIQIDMESPALEDLAESAWASQLKRELESLQESAPGAVADVAEIIHAAARLGSSRAVERGIKLIIDPNPIPLIAAIHPSALRQILIAAFEDLALCMNFGEIRVHTEHQDRQIRIELIGDPVYDPQLMDVCDIREFLEANGGSITVQLTGERMILTLELLSVDRLILVVDDNTDLIHLYRRYVAGTRYHIQHITQGQKLFDALETYSPDVVVLDIMLPDVDGWDLLTRLHENPLTRPIPVIVCSVVRNEELAMALGAARYISKPVQRQQFINALDKALYRAGK